jgi:glycoside/pentoside/hexuronide:cation symporter, GPH family
MLDARQMLSTKEKLAYGLGDAAANFFFQTQITFLMFFYTNVFGIAAGTAGKILLISRIVDAFNDPIVGALADRTNTRWGRYRPWVLWTSLPLAVALVLCYTTPSLSTGGKVIWAIVTYNMFMVLYAANNIPYCALAGVMTSDTHERTSLLSWRFVCAMLAALAVHVLTLDLVRVLGAGDAASGYQLTMAFWGLIGVAFFVVTFVFTDERVNISPKERSSLRQDVSDLLHNGPWIALFGVSILIYIQLSLRSGSMLYYFKYCLRLENVSERIENFGIFNGVGLVFVIIGVTLSKPLTKRYGKHNTFRACLLLSSLFMAAFALVPPDSLAMLLTLQILLQLTFGPTIPILWTMMADVADYSDWKTGRRSTALAFASIIFGLKLGFGIGGWLNGALLEYLGYSAADPLSPSTTRGILLMVSVFPAIVLLIAVGALLFYRLDDRLVKEIEQSLAVRRTKLDS